MRKRVLKKVFKFNLLKRCFNRFYTVWRILIAIKGEKIFRLFWGKRWITSAIGLRGRDNVIKRLCESCNVWKTWINQLTAVKVVQDSNSVFMSARMTNDILFNIKFPFKSNSAPDMYHHGAVCLINYLWCPLDHCKSTNIWCIDCNLSSICVICSSTRKKQAEKIRHMLGNEEGTRTNGKPYSSHNHIQKQCVDEARARSNSRSMNYLSRKSSTCC